MWFSDTRGHKGQNVVDSLGCRLNILTTAMTRIVVDKRTDNGLIIFDLFFTTGLTSKKMFFFLERDQGRDSKLRS